MSEHLVAVHKIFPSLEAPALITLRRRLQQARITNTPPRTLRVTTAINDTPRSEKPSAN